MNTTICLNGNRTIYPYNLRDRKGAVFTYEGRTIFVEDPLAAFCENALVSSYFSKRGVWTREQDGGAAEACRKAGFHVSEVDNLFLLDSGVKKIGEFAHEWDQEGVQ